MRRIRFSLAGLMGLVLVAGVGIAALRNASPAWTGSMLFLTLALLGVSVLGMVYRRDGKRAFWLGWGIFSGGYLALAFAPWWAQEIKPVLPTSLLLSYLHERLAPNGPLTVTLALDQQMQNMQGTLSVTLPARLSTAQALNAVMAPAATMSGLRWLSISHDAESFEQVGHCLAGLLAGLIGGLVGRWFHATGRPAEARRHEPCPDHEPPCASPAESAD